MAAPEKLDTSDGQLAWLALSGLGLGALATIAEFATRPVTPITFQVGSLIIAVGLGIGMSAAEPYAPRWAILAYFLGLVFMVFLQSSQKLSPVLVLSYAAAYQVGRFVVRLSQRAQE